jgi:EAL domain-containing protein (putative c-di-GMP-specific phosphodiesterase class I)
MSDPLHTIDILRRIHDLGIELSIDDFGTGYSSLSYLRKLPVGSVKIDQSFVRELMIDENQAVIVRATIDLGRNLGLRVIAEGVENRSVLDRLASWGCDQAQGYFISKPLSDQGLTNFLTERSLASTNSQQLCF